MPPWAMGMRLDEVRPNFDVFSLGKLLWSMVSGEQFLRLWYYDRDKFNVEQKFSGRRYIHLINPILAQCVVEEEDACLENAKALLGAVDRALEVIEIGADRVDRTVKRKCRVCGIGVYAHRIDEEARDAVRNFGLNPAGSQSFKIFSCDHCGHVQLFDFPGATPAAWKD